MLLEILMHVKSINYAWTHRALRWCFIVSMAYCICLSRRLDHRLLVSKLSAYGLHERACLLRADYFTHRKQRVKMDVTRNEWSQVIKGTPQGSILCPYVFNIFQNDFNVPIKQPV